MDIKLPKEVEFIIDTLNNNGFEAYIVGGCVRDSLLGRAPQDWDITTNALPEKLIDIFDHTVPTGLQHGTVTIVLNNDNYEVTTYRIDGEYLDNRRPENVIFTSSLEEDLSRRDFTINAMAYNYSSGLIDPFRGKEALKQNLITCVGEPNLRFSEDALRMLRAVRFAAQLNFHIDSATFHSIINNYSLIKNVSMERIRDELCKLLLTRKPSDGIRNLHKSNLLSYILPELICCVGFEQSNPHHDKNVFDHILWVLDNTPCNLPVRLAALLHDIAKPECFTKDETGEGHFYMHHMKSAYMAEDILKRLRFDNNTIKKVFILVKEHMSWSDLHKNGAIKRFINRVGIENLDDLFALQTADILGHKPPYDLVPIEALQSSINKILQEKHPLSIKDLAVTGADLIKVGYSPGKQLGSTLNYLLDIVLINPELNIKEELLKIAEKTL